MPSPGTKTPRLRKYAFANGARLVLVAFVAWAPSVAAQVKPATPPALNAPVARSSTDVPYPAGANGNAVVLLELTVEADGTVSRAVVIDGNEPFAEQARRTALAWRFDPARRGGVPVAARVRARVEFHQDLAAGTAAATGPASRTGSGPPQ